MCNVLKNWQRKYKSQASKFLIIKHMQVEITMQTPTSYLYNNMNTITEHKYKHPHNEFKMPQHTENPVTNRSSITNSTK